MGFCIRFIYNAKLPKIFRKRCIQITDKSNKVTTKKWNTEE